MTQTIPEVELPEIVTPNITDRAVFLVIKKKYIPSSTTVQDEFTFNSDLPAGAEAKKPDRSWLWVSKTLFISEEFNAIYTADEKAIARAESFCVPSPLRGLKILPLGNVPYVEEIFKEHLPARQALVDAFIAVYPAAVEAALQRLGSLGDPQDYAPIEVVKESFKFNWQYFQMGVSASVESVKAEMFLKEKDLAQERWKSAEEETQKLLRTSMSGLVDDLLTRLTPGTDGKRKVLREESVVAVRDFLNGFNAKNITDDKELSEMVEKMKKLTSGVTADTLRNDFMARSKVTTAFTEISEALGEMITDSPLRKLRLREVLEDGPSKLDVAIEDAQAAVKIACPIGF